jgi:hypothetical protein
VACSVGRGKRKGEEQDGDKDWGREQTPAVRKKKGASEKEQRRRGKVISQGLMRNFRGLQGPICKTKFSINLKPE